MKTIIAFLAATAVVAGASSAVARDFQASDESSDYALSHSAGSGFGGAYDSVGGGAHNSTISAPNRTDFQAGGNL
ncbi:MAG TPA: hypothetical protein VGG01_09245 [Xanthobacteraceae bacterium]